MKKKRLSQVLAILVFLGMASVMANDCIDIYSNCTDSNPYDPANSAHEMMAWVGYEQGCLNFLDACFGEN